jgi:hypothetical protein
MSSQPIGQVEFAQPTKDGIPFRARLAQTGEVGTLKNRLDEAWQSIKLGLVRAVSIGFVPLEYDIMKEGNAFLGYRFNRWKWLELSTVTIPANSDAKIQQIRALSPEALIERVRAIDSELRAATGRPKSEGSKPVTVSLKGTSKMSKRNIAEQIAGFEASRAA